MNRTTYGIFLALTVCTTACQAPGVRGSNATPPMATGAASPTPTGQPADPGAPDPAAIEQAYRTDAYVKINPVAIAGTSAHSGPLFLYVNKASAPLYRRGFTGTMPEGTTVLKVSEQEGKILAIMAKLKSGSDPEAKDWFYYEKLGAQVIAPGRGGGSCNSCHRQNDATDRLLGTAVFNP